MFPDATAGDFSYPGGKSKSKKPCSACAFGFLEVVEVVFSDKQTQRILVEAGKNSLDGLGGGHLGAVVQVGVDVAGGADVAVAQPLLNVLQSHAVGVEQAGAGMPLRYNYDKPEKPRISRVFGYQARLFILFQPEKSSREVVIS